VSRASFALACALAGAFVLSRAWVADDAYITYRVIDNLLAGHGLRWNADERVQAFTHPLWALLHVPLFALLGSLPVASFALAAICLPLAGALAWRAARAQRLCFAATFALGLAASRAFSDHAVSGLEAPLVALCVAAFAALALRTSGEHAPPAWLGLAAAASLAATARPDALLLLLPALAALVARARGRLPWGRVALGALPLFAWEAFSLLYYGFPFPNTRYAKLETGIPAAALARQGLYYALDLVRRDAASAWILLLALVLAARRAPAALAALRAREVVAPGEPGALAVAALGLGVLVSLAFVVAVGGDFMSGRFFAPAVFLAALVVARELGRAPGAAAAVAAVAVAASLASLAARPADPDATWRGIADERRVFASTTSLFGRPGLRDGAPQRHPWWQDGARARELARERGERVLLVRGAVGMLGFAAGPEVIVIDNFGLGDALLARLPVEDPQRWRIGHFHRRPPEGYLHARETGDASRMQPELARYWQALRLVVAGRLFDPERLVAIARWNTGTYDRLREAYLRSRSAAPPGPRVAPAPARREYPPTGRSTGWLGE
jgi:arabinofuranosyltransferase